MVKLVSSSAMGHGALARSRLCSCCHRRLLGRHQKRLSAVNGFPQLLVVTEGAVESHRKHSVSFLPQKFVDATTMFAAFDGDDPASIGAPQRFPWHGMSHDQSHGDDPPAFLNFYGTVIKPLGFMTISTH